MKKIFVLLSVLLPLNALAVTKQKVSMVTFFPVPYVAYSRLNVTNEMDVGLGKRMCQMSLGCENLPANTRPLSVNSGPLDDGLSIAPSATLKLQGSEVLTFPNGEAGTITLGYGTGPLHLKITAGSLKVAQGNSVIPNLPVASFNTNALLVGGNLYLFGKQFPSCSAIRNGTGTIAWERLNLGGSMHINGPTGWVYSDYTYLVCKTSD